MAFVNRIDIQGIRSVGPGDEDKVSVKFYKPFTLITGENGAGKTTVIEALKYAASGSEPPGAKVGGWIHHPKAETSAAAKAGVKRGRGKVQAGKVLARIQCQFEAVDKTGKTKLISVLRNLQGTIDPKKNKMTKSTLDGAIAVASIEGIKERETTGMKIEDINKELNTYIRVPKPLLEYVIFCHQEDTLWMFSEGKLLKEKFDEIFQSKEYVEVLDQMKKERKAIASESRIKEEKRTSAKQNFDILKTVQADISQTQEDIDGCKNELECEKNKMEPYEQELQTLRNTIANHQFALNSYKQKKERIQNIKSDLEDLEKRDPDVKEKAESYAENMKALDVAIAACESGDSKHILNNDVDQLSLDKKDAQNELDELKKQLAETKTFRSDFQDSMNNVVSNLSIAAKRLKIEENCTTEESRQVVLNGVKLKLDQIIEVEITCSKEETNTLNEKQEGLKNLIAERASQRTNREANISKIKEKEDQIQDFKERIDNMSQQSAQLNRLKKEESQLQKTIDQFSGEEKRVEVEQKIRENNFKREEVIRNVENLEATEHSAKRKNDASKAIIEKQRELKESEDNRSSNESRADSLLSRVEGYEQGQYPSLDELQKFRQSFLRKEKTANENKDKAHRRMLTCQADINSKMKELTQLRRELNESRARVEHASYSDISDERDTISRLQSELEEKQEELAAMSQGKKLFETFLKSLKKKPNCPLCDEDLQKSKRLSQVERLCKQKMTFSNQNELEDEIEETKEKITLSEENIKLLESISDLEKKEENIKQEMEEHKTKLSELKSEHEKLSKEYKNIVSIKQGIAEADPYIRLIQTEGNKIRALQRRVESLQNEFSTVKDAPNYDDLIKSLADARNERKNLDQASKKLEVTRSDVEEKTRNLNQKRNILREEISKISELLEDDDSSIQNKIEALENEINTIKDDVLPPIDSEIDRLESEMENAEADIEESKERYTAHKQKILKQKDKYTTMKIKLEDMYSEHNRKYTDTTNEKIEDTIRNIDFDIGEKQTVLNSIERKIDIKKNELAQFTVQELLLKNAKSHLQKTIDLKSIYEEIRKLKNDMKQDLDGNVLQKLNEKYDKIQSKAENAKIQVAKQEGKYQELIKTLERYKVGIATNKIENASKDYMHALVDHQIYKGTINDMDQLHTVLEQAILAIHEDKMKRLNQVMSHLWMTTYQGSDIETISISTETDATVKGAANKRRNYNYSVMMRRKDGTSLPMRGRASAGQKILASLIIRLALSQCFTSCGILALDEPTTNLDRRNITQFVETLKRLSNSTDHGSQFIIITHDQEFIQKLCGAAGLSRFYRVSKNQKGYSQVEKKTSNSKHEPAECLQAHDSDNDIF